MSRHVTTMTIYDVDHYSDAEKEQIVASYPAYQRDARAKGIPTLGSGRIFPLPEEEIVVPAFPIPKHWARLGGMDFGWTHPTAAVWMAHDRDTDTIYVYDVHKMSEAPVSTHADAIKARGQWIPMAWPHDGKNNTAVGPQLAQQYREKGVNMLPISAQFPLVSQESNDNTRTSRVSVEAGIQEMLSRMETGRFKVFSHLNDWLSEYRIYHREDGVVVKEFDDAISASRYGIMMLRFAEVQKHKDESWRDKLKRINRSTGSGGSAQAA